VVRVHPEPLVDKDGIFGFRMEWLLPITERECQADILRSLEGIHKTGIVHNDLHLGNVMRTKKDKIVMIDLGRSGRVGSKMPQEKRPPWFHNEVYSFDADNIALDLFFGTKLPAAQAI